MIISLSSSTLPQRTLAEILAPCSVMKDRKFELRVDEWKFVGHPFSVQTTSLSITCNIAFVLQVYIYFICDLLQELVTISLSNFYQKITFEGLLIAVFHRKQIQVIQLDVRIRMDSYYFYSDGDLHMEEGSSLVSIQQLCHVTEKQFSQSDYKARNYLHSTIT